MISPLEAEMYAAIRVARALLEAERDADAVTVLDAVYETASEEIWNRERKS